MVTLPPKIDPRERSKEPCLYSLHSVAKDSGENAVRIPPKGSRSPLPAERPYKKRMFQATIPMGSGPRNQNASQPQLEPQATGASAPLYTHRQQTGFRGRRELGVQRSPALLATPSILRRECHGAGLDGVRVSQAGHRADEWPFIMGTTFQSLSSCDGLGGRMLGHAL